MSASLRAHLEAVGRDALAKAAREIVADAQRLAPVDTGQLRSSIDHGPITGNSVTIRASANHAGYVEYGTEHMAAQPYIRPAVYRKRRLD